MDRLKDTVGFHPQIGWVEIEAGDEGNQQGESDERLGKLPPAHDPRRIAHGPPERHQEQRLVLVRIVERRRGMWNERLGTSGQRGAVRVLMQ